MDNSPLLQLMMPQEPTGFQRRYGKSKLTEQMGGEPAFWGPLQRLIFGYPLYGMPAEQANMIMQGQMGQAQDISGAVPRGN